MLANTALSVSLMAFTLLAATTSALPQPHTHANGIFSKRWDGYGVYGGYGSFGFPFAVSFASDFDRNSNRAHFNENTFYANNVHANAANDNVHAFTNAAVIA
ncbi:hypothetical protein IWW37_005296 [Coemansia sp. RSA 2050]|nr:hypothetical protein IWW37_005296 [Coemansia sp. RSA 2050]